MPPSTATATATRRGTMRLRAAIRQAADIEIHSTPCVHPSTSVSGSGLPTAKALTSSAR